MELRKLGIVLLLLMLAGMVMVPIVSAENVFPIKYSINKKSMDGFQSPKSFDKFDPSGEFLAYMNAPVITQNEKDQCQRLIADSKGYEKFKDISHGPTSVIWAYPYTGKQMISTVIGSDTSDVYGLYYAHIDSKNGSVLDEGFVNWKKYW